MALYPHANTRLLRFASSMAVREQSPTLIIHTNGGGTDNGSLYRWFNRATNTDHIAAHFQVMFTGTCEQYVDTARQANAQYAANAYAVSTEVEDGGNANKPFTPQQIDRIVDIALWLKVPAKVSPDGPGGGVGWHSLYGDWNQSHHDCPGSVRIAQIKNDIIPKLAARYKENDVTPDDIKNAVREVLHEEIVQVPAEAGKGFKSVVWSLTQIWGHVLRVENKK